MGDRPVKLITNASGIVDFEDDDVEGIRNPEPLGPFEDDFDAMLRQRAKAGYIPGYGYANDLQLELRAREQGIVESNLIAPHIRQNPPTAQKAVLGGQRIIISGQQPIELINWGGEDVESTAATITLFNAGAFSAAAGATYTPWPNNDAVTTVYFRPYATVAWGTRQAQASVDVDLIRGCQFTVGGSAIYVSLGMEAGPVGATSSAMNLGCMLSFNTTQKFSPITRTFYGDSLTASYSGGFSAIVPPFATSVRAESSFSPAGLLLVFNSASSTTQNALDVITVKGSEMARDIPLPDDCYSVYAMNLAAFTTSARLIFTLAL